MTTGPMPTLEQLIERQPEGRDPARAFRRAVRILEKLEREAAENERAPERGEPFRVYSAE